MHEIELGIDEAKEVIARFDAFKRLIDNQDFKLIIEKGYFENEAIRLVAAKSSPTMSESDHVELDKDIIGVGRLRQYFMAIHQQGVAAMGAVKSFESERELMLEEEANN